MPERPAPLTLPTPVSGAPLWSDAPVAPAPEVPERYEVLREIGRGGLGRVLEAYDRVLQRPVALKELLHDSPAARARFRREIRFTAQLQHPSIVSLYEAVTGPDGQERYAMRLVSGATLDAEVARADSLRKRLALLSHVAAVADAVSYAHARGVVHRDIKPQNVLEGEFGETVLIDWGLAKHADQADLPEATSTPEPTLTHAGAVVGTPAYMAPEQARGEPTDSRADVYALGATLYHVLTGHPPFDGDARGTLERLRQGERPAPIRAAAPGIHDDLASVVARAMAPRPEDRYPTGREFSEDLHRFMTGQLVAARSYSLGDLLRRWAVRHRTPLGMAALAAALLALIAGLSAARIVEERNAARVAAALAIARADALVIANARSGAESDPTQSAAWLASYPPDGADWAAVFNLTQEVESRGVARVWIPPLPDGDCGQVAFGSDGRTVYVAGAHAGSYDAATGAQRNAAVLRRTMFVAPGPAGSAVTVESNGTVWRLDPTTGAQPLGGPRHRPKALAVGSRALVGYADGTLWSTDLDGQESEILLARAQRVSGVAVRGDQWAASWYDGTIAIGDFGHPGAPLVLSHPVPIESVELSTDGTVFIGDAEGGVFALRDGEIEAQLTLAAEVVAVAITADGRLLAAANGGDQVQVLDRATRQVYSPPWPAARATGIAWGAAGVLAVTLIDGTLRLWRPQTGEVASRRTTGGFHRPASFTPDGAHFATCGVEGTLQVWDTPPLRGARVRGHEDRVFHVAMLPDGRVASDSDDQTVQIWTPGEARGTVLRGHTDRVYGIEASADGSRLVSAGIDGLAIVWPVDGGRPTVLRGHEGRVERATFLPDGERVLTAGYDGTLRIWSAEGHVERQVQAHVGAAWWAVGSADGRTVWSAGADRALRRWRPADGTLDTVIASLGPASGPTLRPFLLPDGRVVICAGSEQPALIVIEAGGRRTWPLPVEPSCPSILPSPDGSRLAIPAGDTIGLIDTRDGAYRTFASLHSGVHAVAWSPDSAWLASASLDGTARLWRVSDGGVGIAYRATAPVLAVAFSADGRQVAAAGVDGVVWVGPVEDVAIVPRNPHALRERVAGLTTARAPD